MITRDEINTIFGPLIGSLTKILFKGAQ
jgi:hypothetical protein